MEEKYKGIRMNYLDFDIYSKTIGFFYNDKEKLGTIFGFVLTIIYILISLFLFIFYTISTIKKSNIKVHDSVLYQKEVPEMNINSDTFYFAFGVENYLTGYTRFIDETIYYPKVFYVKKIKEGSIFKEIEEKPLTIERCISDKFGKDYQHLIVKEELNNSYCINNFNLTLSGNFKYDKLSYIKINIYPCVNTTENNNHCKSRNIIDSFLSRTFISLLVKDIGLEPMNYSYPIIPLVQDLYVSIDKSYFRDFAIFFRISEIQTDEGLFYEKLHKKRYLNYQKTTQGIYNRDKNNFYNGESMCEVQLRMSDDIRIQKRSYRKMSEVFSITGGYMQLLSTVFSIITFLINKIGNEVEIVNGLFYFYPKKRKIGLKHYIKKSSIDSNINNNKHILSHNIKNSNEDLDIKDNSYLFSHNNNFYKENINDNCSQSINIIKTKSGKTGDNISKNNNNIKKDSSIEESVNNKSKITFLNNRINNNFDNIRRNIFINKIKTKNNEIINSEREKKYIKFNFFYYYCFSKLINTKKTKDLKKLFNYAISFYKQKLDVVYIFHIILLIEKELGIKRVNINIDQETFYELNNT